MIIAQDNFKKPTCSDPAVDPNIIVRDVHLGIWHIKIATTVVNDYWKEARIAFPLFHRLAVEIYSIAPHLFTTFVLLQLWDGVADALAMKLSSSLLRNIENGIISGKPDTVGLLSAAVARVVCMVLVGYFEWKSEIVKSLIESQVTRHFQLYLMKANLRMDMPTSQEASSSQEVSASDAWSSLQKILTFMADVFKVISQLILIFHLSRTSGGPIFTILCIIGPVLTASASRGIWNMVCFGYVKNEDYKRMHTLQDFSSGGFRQEIISHGLSDWIVGEYKKASHALGNTPDAHAFQQYSRRPLPFFNISDRALAELPMLYCAFLTLYNPSRFSVASIAVLHTCSSYLRYSVECVFHGNEEFRSSVASLKKIYESSNVVNVMSDGTLAYPRLNEKEDLNGSKGMSFELKNISFAYPGSEKTTNSLDKVSLNIKAGQIVVIVGANGSGKSTLIRILSRLYDPSSGEILIDGLPSSDYRVKDLHQTTAILTQDSLIYPFTLAENIGLGYPECSSNMDMIAEAAKEGGASEFVGKLKQGFETSLDPYLESFSINLRGNRKHPLNVEMEKLQKKTDISGGEKQRVVAARSFMRFKSGKIKFVAVDEPSSALDAEGELQLFNGLIGVRAGKTMVFVTHRFGHLTKYADQVICMKDGSIVESGTHAELLAVKGEYAKLYDIQAQAFIEPAASAAKSD